jgi:putative DNA primase/helicase
MSAAILTGETNAFHKQRWPKLVLKSNEPVESAKAFCKNRERPLVYWRGDFYEYTGRRYQPVSADTVRAQITSFLSAARTKVEVKAPNGTEQVDVPFAPNSKSVGEVLSALRCLEGRTFISDVAEAPVWLSDRNNKPDPRNLIALDNAILDLETGATLPHSSDFFATTALPFAYDAKAECPNWERFVGELFPNEQTRREFQKAVGYMLSSDRSQQKVFLVLGPKRSGKSTIMRVMVSLLGRENTVSPDLNELKENFGKEQIIGKKAAFFPDERLLGDTTPVVRWLLKLSGEDDVSIPRKNRSNWQGRPAVRLWISTNETPKFDDASGVIASRFIVFRLTQNFFGREDTGLGDKLVAELPGILNWARKGLRMLREDGQFLQPEQTSDVERMRHIASPALAFADEELEEGDGLSVNRDDLYEVYKDWCKTNGHKPQSCNKFIATLRDAFPGVDERRIGPRGRQTWVVGGVGWQENAEFVLPTGAANDDVMRIVYHPTAAAPPTRSRTTGLPGNS